ncbi:hypothetical protein F5148DRAFT_1146421 [Russula earlei]|uniref:Uncharacterized protein n=1 Tax=Russula earlei TaxID=71964 RepID=A0ACC0UL60_9AGAM|nr:hypothetical protein F5148DRAFT_1146421 [Russula earlei]
MIGSETPSYTAGGGRPNRRPNSVAVWDQNRTQTANVVAGPVGAMVAPAGDVDSAAAQPPAAVVAVAVAVRMEGFGERTSTATRTFAPTWGETWETGMTTERVPTVATTVATRRRQGVAFRQRRERAHPRPLPLQLTRPSLGLHRVRKHRRDRRHRRGRRDGTGGEEGISGGGGRRGANMSSELNRKCGDRGSTGSARLRLRPRRPILPPPELPPLPALEGRPPPLRRPTKAATLLGKRKLLFGDEGRGGIERGREGGFRVQVIGSTLCLEVEVGRWHDDALSRPTPGPPQQGKYGSEADGKHHWRDDGGNKHGAAGTAGGINGRMIYNASQRGTVTTHAYDLVSATFLGLTPPRRLRRGDTLIWVPMGDIGRLHDLVRVRAEDGGGGGGDDRSMEEGPAEEEKAGDP